MRNVLTLLATFASLAFLTLGYSYWKDKTSVQHVIEKKEDVHKQGEKSTSPQKDSHSKFSKIISNWPKEAQATFMKKVNDGEPYKIAIVGSNVLGKEKSGWSTKLQSALIDTYGEQTLNVSIHEYPIVSDEFINTGHYKEVTEVTPDLILFEPFKLKDNGLVSTENNHNNILEFMSKINQSNENPVLLLQPSHPVTLDTYSYYDDHIDELEVFAKNNEITYLDHWSHWPSGAELNTYLIENQSEPNEKGHQLWFEFLEEYFIAEE